VTAAVGHTGGITVQEFFSLVDPSLTWKDLEQLVADSPVPVLLKGVQTGEDARLAAEHGAAGIVVSNHGGRQLDTVAATIDLLPECIEAVDGRIEVLVDGGIRRGTDVLVALALGARAVLVGRAALWGLAAGGEAGARHILEILRSEIELGQVLLGAPELSALGRHHVSSQD
jgi:isopentenyl diphosphate isomerase/L-lactate dehydrogenase-like FMN-dependent dehydrogenase